MAYQITSESYGRRLPKITATADSTDDLATLGTDWAEGSTCVIGSTTYSLDKVQGWVEPGSGGGGGAGGGVVVLSDNEGTIGVSYEELESLVASGKVVVAVYEDDGYHIGVLGFLGPVYESGDTVSYYAAVFSSASSSGEAHAFEYGADNTNDDMTRG